MAGKKFAAEFALRRNVSAQDKILIQDSDDDVVKYAYPPQIASLSGYAYAQSVANLPLLPSNKSIGYIVGQMLYIYVGGGGDTRDGLYQSVGFFVGPQGVQGEKGEQGERGEQGVQGPKGDNGGLSLSDLDAYLTEKHYLTTGALENILAGYVSQTSLMRDYVTIGTLQEITGVKNFKQGVQFDGLAMYKSIDDTIYIDANVVVRGGITARGTNTTTTPSLFDALPIDGDTIKRTSDGRLYVDADALNISGGGGVADSVSWENVTGKPSWIGSTKPTYTPQEIGALPITGGTVNGNLNVNGDGIFTQRLSCDNLQIYSSTSINPFSVAGNNRSGFIGIGSYSNGVYSRYGLISFPNENSSLYRYDNSYNAFEILDSNNIGSYNAGSATKLQTPRSIWGKSFDGTDNINGVLTLDSLLYYNIYLDNMSGYGLNFRTGNNLSFLFVAEKVGVGTTTPQEKFHVHGNILATGGITARYTSDERLKTNLRPINAGQMILSLGRVREFEYIDSEVEKNNLYKGSHIGLIYQDVKGSALSKMCFEREDGYGSLNYCDTSLKALLVGVAQEHEVRLTEDERDIQAVKEENKALRKEIEYLKQIVA